MVGCGIAMWQICCTASCRIVVSSSVAGVVQHVRNRCPCSEVWHFATSDKSRQLAAAVSAREQSISAPIVVLQLTGTRVVTAGHCTHAELTSGHTLPSCYSCSVHSVLGYWQSDVAAFTTFFVNLCKVPPQRHRCDSVVLILAF